jgi:hypothetical protein
MMPAFASFDSAPRMARRSTRPAFILPRGWHSEAEVRFQEHDEESMPFLADVIGPARLFLRSTVLFEPGEDLVVSFPLPNGSSLRARGRVMDCNMGEDNGMSGMSVHLDEPLEAAA